MKPLKKHFEPLAKDKMSTIGEDIEITFPSSELQLTLLRINIGCNDSTKKIKGHLILSD